MRGARKSALLRLFPETPPGGVRPTRPSRGDSRAPRAAPHFPASRGHRLSKPPLAFRAGSSPVEPETGRGAGEGWDGRSWGQADTHPAHSGLCEWEGSWGWMEGVCMTARCVCGGSVVSLTWEGGSPSVRFAYPCAPQASGPLLPGHRLPPDSQRDSVTTSGKGDALFTLLKLSKVEADPREARREFTSHS